MSATLISIIGPPAVGKTTLAEGLSTELPGELIYEDYEGNPFLADSYTGGGDACLPAQLYYLMSRVKQLALAAWPVEGRFISDYGFCQDRIFAERRLGADDLKLYRRVARRVEGLVKGPDVLLSAFGELLSAFGELADPQIRLVVAGDGPLAASLQRQAGGLGIADRLSMIGHVPHTDLPALYSAADLLCVPSRSEGCPNVVLESLACGTPVVGSQVGAIPDLVTSDCGTTVAPEDPVALCAGLRQALDASWDRTQVRARVAGMTWADNARKLHAVLRGALTGGRPS